MVCYRKKMNKLIH